MQITMNVKMNRDELNRVKEIYAQASVMIDHITDSSVGNTMFVHTFKRLQTEVKITSSFFGKVKYLTRMSDELEMQLTFESSEKMMELYFELMEYSLDFSIELFKALPALKALGLVAKKAFLATERFEVTARKEDKKEFSVTTTEL